MRSRVYSAEIGFILFIEVLFTKEMHNNKKRHLWSQISLFHQDHFGKISGPEAWDPTHRSESSQEQVQICKQQRKHFSFVE